MSKAEKLIQRLLSVPTDFTWDELCKLLLYFGFTELRKQKTAGSRRKFTDAKKNVINLHKPHPGKIVKKYTLRQVIEQLRENGYIKNE
jgi:predicted RNA binding protein YcfA (HicA-like mRNA interferase family)